MTVLSTVVASRLFLDLGIPTSGHEGGPVCLIPGMGCSPAICGTDSSRTSSGDMRVGATQFPTPRIWGLWGEYQPRLLFCVSCGCCLLSSRAKYHKLKFGTDLNQGEKKADLSEQGTQAPSEGEGGGVAMGLLLFVAVPRRKQN